MNKFATTLLLASSLLATISAGATEPTARAMINSTKLISFLDGVPPENIGVIVNKISDGEIKRYAPDLPVWIIDTSTGTLLYYQGQPGFVGKSSTLLVDDRGVRFGQKALDNARNSRSGWVSVSLAQGTFRAYCHSKYPMVVCSLIP